MMNGTCTLGLKIITGAGNEEPALYIIEKFQENMFKKPGCPQDLHKRDSNFAGFSVSWMLGTRVPFRFP
jgi:hypothetical protein